MKKSLLGIIYVLIIFCTLTGCGLNSNIEKNTDDNANSVKIRGNCSAIECMKQITINCSVSDINRIIGFEGELTDENHNIYYWKISENEGIKAAYYNGSKGTITADYDMDTLANSKVNLSRYSELRSKINDGISYDEFKSYIGNVDGIITEKSSISNKYTWVSSDGSYLTASFSNKSNQCIFVSGKIK